MHILDLLNRLRRLPRTYRPPTHPEPSSFVAVEAKQPAEAAAKQPKFAVNTPKAPKLPKAERPKRIPTQVKYPGSQAATVISAFGGARKLCRALTAAGFPKDASCIYKWLYPYPRGNGGHIPVKALPHVKRAAIVAGVKLSAIDLHPTRLKVVEYPSRYRSVSKMIKIAMMERGIWK